MPSSPRLLPRRPSRPLLTVLALAALGLFTAVLPVSPPRSVPVHAQGISDSFVGRVGRTDNLISVVSNGRDVLAYVCNSTDRSDWFRGTLSVSTGILELQSGSGAKLQIEAASISATALETGTTPRGVFELPNAQVAFGTEVATATTGLFRSEQIIDGNRHLVGWIVGNDGTFAGADNANPGDGPDTVTVIGLTADNIDLANLQTILPNLGTFDMRPVHADFFE